MQEQIQSVTEASNGDDAAIVLSGASTPAKPKGRSKKRKGPGGDAVDVNLVPPDIDKALEQQIAIDSAIDLATAQSPLTDDEKDRIVEILQHGKGERLAKISEFAAKVSSEMDRQIAVALAEQVEIQRQKRVEAEAYTPPVDTAALAEIVKRMAERGRVLPSDYQPEDTEE